MKYLNGWRIELGKLESNEKFHEDGGWINGVLTNGEKTFSVGGGWIHNQEGANHYNSCCGMSYSGGGPNPYLVNGALEAGGFESYRGSELGDIDDVYSHFGLDEEYYDYNEISDSGISWINNLQTLPGFPDITLNKMSNEDRDALVEYLRNDDGSLSEEDLEFSNEVANEIENLEALDLDGEKEVLYGEILKLNGEAWNNLDLSDNAEYQALAHSVEEVIAELKEDIEENYEDNAKTFAKVAKLKGVRFKIEETGEYEEEIEDTLYKTVTRQLLANDEVIAEWTICAQGRYVNNNNNPNYSIGWNVTENTDSGNDGIDRYSALYIVLDTLDLEDEAQEVPNIDEPEHEEEE